VLQSTPRTLCYADMELLQSTCKCAQTSIWPSKINNPSTSRSHLTADQGVTRRSCGKVQQNRDSYGFGTLRGALEQGSPWGPGARCAKLTCSTLVSICKAMSVQAAFFIAMRDDKPAAYKAALQRGAQVNFKYDRWIQWNSQCWGLRCQQYLFGRFYTGFSAREYWMAPAGVSGKHYEPEQVLAVSIWCS
jgi:hypothetical protein